MALGYLVIVSLGFLVSLQIAFRTWSSRDRTGSLSLCGIALAAAVWTGGTAALVLVETPGAEQFWHGVSYVGMVAAPIAYVVFALEYTGYRAYLTRATVGGLLAIGASFLVLVWTNPWHGLYWASVDTAAATPIGLSTTPAAGFLAFVVFTYLLLLAGTGLLTLYALGLPSLYRYQASAILFSVIVPWVANVPHVLQLMQADYTPVALSVTAASLWLAIFRYELTGITPVALRTVFENISTGVYVLDENDRVADVNAAGRRFLGTDDAVGQHARDIAPDPALYERFRDGTVTQDVVEITSDLTTETRYYDIRVTPIERGRSGQIGRLFAVSDITEQRRQHERLERQKAQFEEFASVVSHDLRNPLSVAAGNVALARENEAATADRLDRVDRALSRMESLIDDLLELARRGEGLTATERVRLSRVAAASWDAVETGGATLDVVADGCVTADRSRLRQLFENLFRNAVEHGGPDVTVTVGVTPDGFYVADDGRGIPADHRSVVVEDGYSGSDTGTGLGLGIVAGVVQAHDWSLSVGASTDNGARFDITGAQIHE